MPTHPLRSTSLWLTFLLLAPACLELEPGPDPEADQAEAASRKRCRSAADCNDGNSCTTDACVAGACVFTPVTTPQACDDGNPCSWGDACQAGTCRGQDTLVVLTGSQVPASEGWTSYLETTSTTSDGSIVTVDTAASPSAQSVSSHGLPLAATWWATHDLEFVAKVGSATSNQYDGSAVVFPAFSGWYGVGVEREQMVMLEDTYVTWGDESQQYALAGGTWHTYRLSFPGGGGAHLYVDNTLALSRATFTAGSAIGFGDHSNDWGVDGSFAIDQIRLVPGPTCPVGPPPPPPPGP